MDFGNQWTKQMGFPLVTAKYSNSSILTINQKRYMISPSNPGIEKYYFTGHSYEWDVPIWYQVGKGNMVFKWLKKGT
ncbi:unnamed protein product [Strongylus vulgaris]|uniref:Uncharacterized protein n=1 Tax=Strongylus vulgaris TaxID=40348 RepID=A0A3P7KZQ4_STRVU|nr:unnamed protein product [Strongylus vulgaris]